MDLGNEGLEEGLAGGRVTGFDDLAGVGLEGTEVFVAERLGRLGVVGGELVAAGVQAVELAGEFGDPRRACLLGHGAVLEGSEVALQRLIGSFDIRVDALDLGFALGALGVLLGERVGDRLAHERFLVEDLDEPLENRVFERLGGEAV